MRFERQLVLVTVLGLTACAVPGAGGKPKASWKWASPAPVGAAGAQPGGNTNAPSSGAASGTAGESGTSGSSGTSGNVGSPGNGGGATSGGAPGPTEGSGTPTTGGVKPGGGQTGGSSGGGGRGGSGGGGSAATVTFTGTVTAAGSGDPIAGATVEALGQRGVVRALTAADGSYTLAGPGLEHAVAAVADGRQGLARTAWTGACDLVLPALHAPDLTRDLDRVPVSGLIQDPGGTPVADAVVVGADGDGGAFGPYLTGPDGRFEGFADVAGEAAATGFGVLAWDAAGARLVAQRAIPDAAGDLGGLTLQTRSGFVYLRPDAGGARLSATIKVGLEAGPELAIADYDPAWSPGEPGALDAPFFEATGLRYWAEAHTGDGAAESSWRAPVAGGGVVAPRLLALPGVLPQPQAGQRLTWPAVAGADGYAVRLRNRPEGQLLWEASTTDPAVPLVGWPAFTAAELEIVARVATTHEARRLVAVPGGAP